MLRNLFRRRRPLSVRLAVLSATIAFAVGLALLLFQLWPSVPQDAPLRRAPLPAGSYLPAPLAVGSPAPAFGSGTWLNGPPPAWGASGVRLVVLDIWAHW